MNSNYYAVLLINYGRKIYMGVAFVKGRSRLLDKLQAIDLNHLTFADIFSLIKLINENIRSGNKISLKACESLQGKQLEIFYISVLSRLKPCKIMQIEPDNEFFNEILYEASKNHIYVKYTQQMVDQYHWAVKQSAQASVISSDNEKPVRKPVEQKSSVSKNTEPSRLDRPIGVSAKVYVFFTCEEVFSLVEDSNVIPKEYVTLFNPKIVSAFSGCSPSYKYIWSAIAKLNFSKNARNQFSKKGNDVFFSHFKNDIELLQALSKKLHIEFPKDVYLKIQKNIGGEKLETSHYITPEKNPLHIHEVDDRLKDWIERYRIKNLSLHFSEILSDLISKKSKHDEYKLFSDEAFTLEMFKFCVNNNYFPDGLYQFIAHYYLNRDGSLKLDSLLKQFEILGFKKDWTSIHEAVIEALENPINDFSAVNIPIAAQATELEITAICKEFLNDFYESNADKDTLLSLAMDFMNEKSIQTDPASVRTVLEKLLNNKENIEMDVKTENEVNVPVKATKAVSKGGGQTLNAHIQTFLDENGEYDSKEFPTATVFYDRIKATFPTTTPASIQNALYTIRKKIRQGKPQSNTKRLSKTEKVSSSPKPQSIKASKSGVDAGQKKVITEELLGIKEKVVDQSGSVKVVPPKSDVELVAGPLNPNTEAINSFKENARRSQAFFTFFVNADPELIEFFLTIDEQIESVEKILSAVKPFGKFFKSLVPTPESQGEK